MTAFEKQKIIEVVLYILNKTGGIDYYHLFNILYFANQRSLVEWGRVMTADKFCALPHGPVPTILYNTIKGEKSILSGMRKDIHVIEYYLLPKRESDTDYLSRYDRDVLDECISRYGKMEFAELEKTSHTNCWEKARAQKGNHVIAPGDIARDGGASEEFIKYINDSIAFDEALGN
ncbi:Panacea domain-containing protein [uncultured Bacteroides sp.]|uniref:Panacea domain-containing protein n=1 Tax=uncultured Bacteroides sp. TaxID=162156 RepID=UPI0025F3F9BA|nr:Panacea domain-containing protein [uncultured Bacteroides sp.]